MSTYAQTNVQLFNQLRQNGYKKTELSFIRGAYDLSVRLFVGHFLASGRTQIAHVVGTASILGSMNLPAEVVASGLLHNAYRNGDFGRGKGDISNAARRQIADAIGKNAEEYVYRFPALIWNPRTIPLIRADLDSMNPMDRNVLLIRLAEILEHHLDLEGFYYHGGIEKCHGYISRVGHVMVEMAEKLGYPRLAAELKRVIQETLEAEIPEELPGEISRSSMSVIVPKSYSKRLSVALYQEFTRCLRYFQNLF